MTTSTTPNWRQAFNQWEEAVAPVLEEITASSGFHDLLAVATRMNATMAEEAEKLSRQWLHAFNLPAATDISKLRHQIAGLEQEVKATKRLVKQQADDQAVPDEGRAVLNLVDNANGS